MSSCYLRHFLDTSKTWLTPSLFGSKYSDSTRLSVCQIAPSSPGPLSILAPPAPPTPPTPYIPPVPPLSAPPASPAPPAPPAPPSPHPPAPPDGLAVVSAVLLLPVPGWIQTAAGKWHYTHSNHSYEAQLLLCIIDIYIEVWTSTLKSGFTNLKSSYLEKYNVLEKISQEKWQNKAHIYIRQYVQIGFFSNGDLKKVSIQK